MSDPVHHPSHYTKHPSGVECIELTEHMNFNLGNAFKYLHRAWLKNNAEEDFKKTLWYLEREQERSLKHGRFVVETATIFKAHTYFLYEQCPARLAIWNYIEHGNRKYLDEAVEAVKTIAGELAQLNKLKAEGHPDHCAKRQVYGDGACECDLYSKGYKPYAWIEGKAPFEVKNNV